MVYRVVGVGTTTAFAVNAVAMSLTVCLLYLLVLLLFSDRVAAFFVACRQCNLQFARTNNGVLEKELVKVAEPKEQERPGMLLLQLLILPQHRRWV
jgi:hypothetical protein